MPARRAVRALSVVVSLPPTMAHEATHALFARPFASRVTVANTLSAEPSCRVWWAEETPAWAIALAALAPLLVGILVGLLGLSWIVLVRYVPATAEGWLVASIATTWWGIYVTPSLSDLLTALRASEK